VSELPDTVWRATSLFRTGEEVREHLPRPRGDQVLPFVLLKGEVWAFHDLADVKGPSKQAVDPDSAERLDAARLLKSDDRNIYVWLLNGALREALLRRGVRLDRGHTRYYFLPDHETITRQVQARTKTGRAQSAKKVVRQEGAGSDHSRDIWWHLAAQLRFEQFAPGSWGLTIRPEFHLTKDGRAPLEPWRVGRKVTKRKSRMYNEGYFDAVHFFRYFLLDGKARFTLKVGRQAIAVDGDFPNVDAKWPQIADKRFDPISMAAPPRRRSRPADRRCHRPLYADHEAPAAASRRPQAIAVLPRRTRRIPGRAQRLRIRPGRARPVNRRAAHAPRRVSAAPGRVPQPGRSPLPLHDRIRSLTGPLSARPRPHPGADHRPRR
jgi:hypothetical protein